MWFGGWQNPWPLSWGSGSLIESLYEAFKATMGIGHMADRDGADWRWREAVVSGLAVGVASIEQAFYQYEPAHARAGLVYYRELYRIPEGTSDQKARDIAEFHHHDTGGLDIPSVLVRLRTIDSRFTAKLVAAQIVTTSDPGTRVFESWNGLKPFNIWGRRETRLSNHSSSFTLIVTLPVENIGDDEQIALTAAREFLDEGVAWCDYSLTTGAGFRVGRSPLGRVRLVV